MRRPALAAHRREETGHTVKPKPRNGRNESPSAQASVLRVDDGDHQVKDQQQHDHHPHGVARVRLERELAPGRLRGKKRKDKKKQKTGVTHRQSAECQHRGVSRATKGPSRGSRSAAACTAAGGGCRRHPRRRRLTSTQPHHRNRRGCAVRRRDQNGQVSHLFCVFFF